MVEKFLKPQSISKRLAAFKDIWYGIARKIEELSRYKSGFDDEFKNALKDILKSLQKCRHKLETVNPSIKHNLPSMSSEIDKRTTAVITAIDEFSRAVEKDVENVINLRKLKKRANDIEETIERMEIRFRDVESKTSDFCTRYFERKKEYKREHGIIDEKINAKIDRVRKNFYEKIKPIVEEYDIVFGAQEIEINQLFSTILQNPAFVEGVSLVPKEVKMGFFDSIFKKTEDMDKGAKETVLRYVSKEIASDAKPIEALKMQALVKLDSKFADLKGLERACSDAEKRRSEIMAPRQDLLNELSNIRKSDAFSYEDYDKVFSIREAYLKMFNEKTPALREFLSFVTRSFEGYEYEPDVEKRELKSQIKELVSNIKTLEEENRTVKALEKEKTALRNKLDEIKTASRRVISKQETENVRLKEKLEGISKEYAKYKKDAVGTLTKELEKQDAVKKDLESKMVELMNEKDVIKEELEKEKQTNKTLRMDIRDRTDRQENLEVRYDSLKAAKKELDGKLKQTTARVKRFEKYMKLALHEEEGEKEGEKEKEGVEE
jgi:chromosome segregation ATPase